MLRQEQEGLGAGLENIRACCGGKLHLRLYRCFVLIYAGKHDVSTLSHSHSHANRYGHNHRGLSLRGTVSRRSTAGP